MLEALLAEAKSLGFLGPGPINEHVDLARRFLTVIERLTVVPTRAIDLGTGGGVPGLALALWTPSTKWIFVEANDRRATFLTRAAQELELAGRVKTVNCRAEILGRDDVSRETFDLVTARSFGSPAVTAECGSAFLQVGGHLLVAEPPDSDISRWPLSGVSQLGLSYVDSGDKYISMHRKLYPLDHKYPRRVGVPAKRPLF